MRLPPRLPALQQFTRALSLGGPQDRTSGQKCGFVAVGGVDGQIGCAAQHHQSEPAVGRVRDDQQVGTSIGAVDSHHVLGLVFPSWPVEVGWSLQRWPVDVDGGDVAEQGGQGRNKVGQFDWSCDLRVATTRRRYHGRAREPLTTVRDWLGVDPRADTSSEMALPPQRGHGVGRHNPQAPQADPLFGFDRPRVRDDGGITLPVGVSRADSGGRPPQRNCSPSKVTPPAASRPRPAQP